MQPAVVYANELSRLGYGRPMWMPDQPEPCVEIGDVGFVETASGSFRRLFNVTRPPWDPLNHLGVPEHFKRLDLSLVQTSEDASFLKMGPICSHTISNKIIQQSITEEVPDDTTLTQVFGCSRGQGALLFLGEDAPRVHCGSNTIMPRYMAANYANWCRFAKSKNIDLEGGRFEGPLLVRGFTKSSGWGVAAWMPDRDSHDLTVSVSSDGSLVSNVTFTTSSSMRGPQFRYGPPRRNFQSSARFTPPSTPRSAPVSLGHRSNQSAFLTFYKAKSRVPVTDESNSVSEPKIAHSKMIGCEYFDPLDEALEYILEKSSADIAVVSHEDINGIYQYGWPKNLLAYLRTARPSCDVSRLPDWQCVGTITTKQQNPRPDPVDSPTIARQPSFVRPKGTRQLPKRSTERQSMVLDSHQIPTPPPSPGIPGTILEEASSWDEQGPSESLRSSLSRMSSVSTFTTTARSSGTPSRSPSPFTPQASNSRGYLSPSGMYLAPPENNRPTPHHKQDVHEVPSAPHDIPQTSKGYPSNRKYETRRRVGPSGSTSPVKGPRPRFRPLSTVSVISNVVACGEFTQS